MNASVELTEKLTLLNESINSYEKLIDYKYFLTFGHKGKTELISIVFLPSSYIHVAGINKLKDISTNHNASKVLYRVIKSNERLRLRLVKSRFFDKIVLRLKS